jgi:multicomponent Na+:H+ antiporter subunit C
MSTVFIVMVGMLTAASIYMFLARDLPRVLIGFVLLGTATNLAIFVAGRVGSMLPPLVEPGAKALAAEAANPLPQALILTAIVIGLTAFALMLVVKAYGAFATISIEEVDEAEPRPVKPQPEPLAPAFRQKQEAA